MVLPDVVVVVVVIIELVVDLVLVLVVVVEVVVEVVVVDEVVVLDFLLGGSRHGSSGYSRCLSGGRGGCS